MSLCKHCGWEHSDWIGCSQAEVWGMRSQVPALLKPADNSVIPPALVTEKPKFDRVAHMAWVREQKKLKAKA